MGVKRVAIYFPSIFADQMPYLRGICEYARTRSNWTIFFSPEWGGFRLSALRDWPGDGLIAVIRTRSEAASARELGIPVVNISGFLQKSEFPRVMVDQEAVGRLAAEHLMRCGYKHFAFVGIKSVWFSRQRQRAFEERLRQEGRLCDSLHLSYSFGRPIRWYEWGGELATFLASLPRPVGVFAVRDYIGAVAVEVCLQHNWHVPNEIGILGAGNEAAICEFCSVPLSSIARNPYQAGYLAAQLLDRLIEGEKLPPNDYLVPPEGIVHRASTELVVFGDSVLARALKFLRESYPHPIRVNDVAEAAGISIRLLQLRFQDRFRTTISEYLQQLRVERAKRLLLAHPTEKLRWISHHCGFRSVRQFRDTFKRVTNLTPSKYRLMTQAGGDIECGSEGYKWWH